MGLTKNVNFETAKLLKKKGFDEPCRGRIHCSHFHFIQNNVIPDNVPTNVKDMFAPIQDWNNARHSDPNKKGGTLIGLYLSLPTIAEVVMWLYDKHGIWVWVERYATLFRPYAEEVGSERFGKWEGHKFNSPTEAYLEVIAYALKNLIK